MFSCVTVVQPGLLVYLVSHFQVLGDKPDLSEGADDEDTEADLFNRKMAKLYMVQC